MTQRTIYAAETWQAIYRAFEEVNFSVFDYDSIKQALLDYARTYYPEHFNDFIESSEFIALIESFAYIAEQLAYRVDMVAHESFITTAQRKQSILKLAKLISYKATRNIPVRGLVKLTTISTSERVIDSRGQNLAGLTIVWNDPNNSNWKEQFFLVMGRVLASSFGSPQKTFQVGDVIMDLYSLANESTNFTNGVFPYSASTGLDTYPMELVPADVDTNGPFEREPDLASSLSIIYSNDGIGDGSDYTGFLLYTKQGVLTRIDYDIEDRLPNRRISLLPNNVNATDVWVQRLDEVDNIAERWHQVETIAEQNLVFNDIRDTRSKYEVDTLENDRVELVFGDGDFSDAPVGTFRFWLRQSANASVVIAKNKVTNEPFSFSYLSSTGNREVFSSTFSLTTTLQNGGPSETIGHVRQAAPATYYAQNRMVNGQDYNTFPLKDPTILRLKTINRTFAGQPKYIDWNDASGAYENIKLFGDDARLRYELGLNSIATSVAGQALVDGVIEPLLSDTGVINSLLHAAASDPLLQGVVSAPRRSFIEDNRGARYYDKTNSPVAVLNLGGTPDGSLKEKTALQGLIDRHWYGEPIEFIEAPVGGGVWARIQDPDLFPEDDSKIYSATVPRTIDGVNKYPPGDLGSGLQPIAEQEYFALRFNQYHKAIGTGTIAFSNRPGDTSEVAGLAEVWTIEILGDSTSFAVRSNLRGSFPSGTINSPYNIKVAGAPASIEFFTITAGSTAFAPGDAFIIDVPATVGSPTNRETFFVSIPALQAQVNLNGWWQVLGLGELQAAVAASGLPGTVDTFIDESAQRFNPLGEGAQLPYSWEIFIKKVRQQPTNTVIGYELHWRDLKLVVESPETNFWYNDAQQIIDGETKKRVYDNVKILRSNLDSNGQPLKRNQIYDVVGAVKDSTGEVDPHKLEVVPTDLLQEDSSGDLVPDRLLQFETFAAGSYEYFTIADPDTILDAEPLGAVFGDGSFISDDGLYGRRLALPSPADLTSGAVEGLDFMWQHFTPFGNIIDPSVTNIHDAFVLTRGYYDSAISYVRGVSSVAPSLPTPLELRNSYGYLLTSKMLSDTVVLHPGKLRFMFGSLAEPQFRARFKVVRAKGATLTNERIKEEILNVINTYFDIDGWDFGDTFYATELTSLMHQRLPADIATVVLVPIYSTNSFGDLYTVECGEDEILQSAARLSDIEIVEALTPTVIRQK